MAFLVNPYQVQAAVSEEFSNTYSVDFDGVNDYVETTTGLNGSLDYSDTWSISSWLYIDQAGGANWNSAWSNVISGSRGIFMRETNGNKCQFFIYDAGAYKYIETSSIPQNTWFHMVCTYDGSGGMNVYVNGSLDNASTITSGSPSNITSSEAFNIGRHSSSSAFYWTGKIDEVGVWSVELDADAVTALYNSGEPFDIKSDSGDYDNSSSLIGFWRMGDGDTYPTITDNSTNSNDGTMTNQSSGDIVEDTP